MVAFNSRFDPEPVTSPDSPGTRYGYYEERNTTSREYKEQNYPAVYEYNAFGETIRATGPAADINPFRFSTKYHDGETGLYYYGFRYYDPGQGRFLNRDPIEEQGGLNLYAFVGNDPVNRWDFLGLQWWNLFSWFGDDTIEGEEILEKRKFVKGTEMTFPKWSEIETMGMGGGYYVYQVDFEAEVEGETKYIDCCTREEIEYTGDLYYDDTIGSDERAGTEQPLYVVVTGDVGIGIMRYTLRGLITAMLLPDVRFARASSKRYPGRFLSEYLTEKR